jgi:endonuclease YncB( thermonuclease family)
MAAKRTRRRRSTTSRSKSESGFGMLPWFAVATVALVVGYDHWADIKPKAMAAVQMASAPLTMAKASVAAPAPSKPMPLRQSGALPVPPAPIPVSISALAAARSASPPLPSVAPVPSVAPIPASVSESFGLCGEGAHFNCVLDGSTFWVRGVKVRLADIDTPALSPPRCVEEERRGQAAKVRLLGLLNAGPFILAAASRDDDKGQKLRTALRGGRSIGDMLISEGLAHRAVDHRSSWCA